MRKYAMWTLVWGLVIALIIPSLTYAIGTDWDFGDGVYCGDGICQSDPEYNEMDVLGLYYCPEDCGILINSNWCEDTYGLIPEDECPACPICPVCPSGGSSCPTPTCSISSLSSSELGGWCSTNGYSADSLTSSFNAENLEILLHSPFLWILIFIAFGIGYYVRDKK